MRVSTALLIRNLISKLHPPTPVTAQESQKLLRLLDTSFKQKLNANHPSPRPVADTPSSEVPLLGTSEATALHLNSVLHHPLLEASKSPGAVEASRCQSAVSRFTEAVESGSVDNLLLQTCCKQYLHGLQLGDRVAPHLKLGDKIDAWLASVSDAEKAHFLVQPSYTIPFVLPVMYRDKLEQVVWGWLHTLYSRPWLVKTSPSFENQRHLYAEDFVVSEMIYAALRSNDLQYAVQQYIKASEYRASSLPQASQTPPEPLKRSWIRVSQAILPRRQRHGITSSVYDSLLKYCVAFESGTSVITRGFLELYHPEKPSSSSLFSELFDTGPLSEAQITWCHKGSARKQRAISSAILDAAELALKEGNPVHAQAFLDLTTRLWPSVFVSTESTQPVHRLARAREDYLTNEPWTAALALS